MMKSFIGYRLQNPRGNRAGSRLRGLLPLGILQQNNLPVELYQDRNREHYKIVIFQKLYNAQEQQLAARLKNQGALIVLDMCDNIFFNPLNDVVYARKIHNLKKMMELADVITVSTSELEKYFSHHNVVTIRDGVEEIASTNRRFQITDARHWQPTGKFRELIWFGVAESERGHRLMLQLLTLEPLLGALQREYNLRLTILSNNSELYNRYIRKLPIPTRYFPWKNTRNAHRLLQQHEVCVLPIPVDSFTACKTHNRLSLALNAGLAVVADSIPSYQQFTSCCFLDNWEEGLRAYLSSPALRAQHVQKGQEYIKQHFSIERAARDWWQLFHSLLPGEIPAPTDP